MALAIEVKPENNEVIREVADIVVMDINEFPGVRYLVWGVNDPVVNWILISKEEFEKNWEFQEPEREGEFTPAWRK